MKDRPPVSGSAHKDLVSHHFTKTTSKKPNLLKKSTILLESLRNSENTEQATAPNIGETDVSILKTQSRD